MPELDVEIGGRMFKVACQDGEETFLKAAAVLLDAEAQPLVQQGGRMTEARLLLMAGLMLADRMAGLDELVRAADQRIRELEAHNHALQHAKPPEAQRIEVPVLPAGLTDRLAQLAAEAEAMADEVEERAAALSDGVSG